MCRLARRVRILTLKRVLGICQFLQCYHADSDSESRIATLALPHHTGPLIVRSSHAPPTLPELVIRLKSKFWNPKFRNNVLAYSLSELRPSLN